MTMRTPAMEAEYTVAKKNGSLVPLLDEPAIKEWQYWKLIANRFPHNRHHVRNDLLVLKEPAINFFAVRPVAFVELQHIYAEVAADYDYMKINFPSVISVPDFVHVHLLTLKKEYK